MERLLVFTARVILHRNAGIYFGAFEWGFTE